MTEVGPGMGQLLFWPAAGPGRIRQPFRSAGGHRPGRATDVSSTCRMIFMSNTMASPRYRENNRLKPLHNGSLNGLIGSW